MALLDGIWLLLKSLKGSQGSLSSGLDKLLVPKSGLKVMTQGKGQQILCCVEEE
jgi:hypothetical protein